MRAERKRLKLSRKELAATARLHPNEIGLIERGEVEPYLLTALILADALGVTLKSLAEGVPAPRKRRPARYKRGGEAVRR